MWSVLFESLLILCPYQAWEHLLTITRKGRVYFFSLSLSVLLTSYKLLLLWFRFFFKKHFPFFIPVLEEHCTFFFLLPLFIFSYNKDVYYFILSQQFNRYLKYCLHWGSDINFLKNQTFKMKLLIHFNKYGAQKEDTIPTNSSPSPEYTTVCSTLQ